MTGTILEQDKELKTPYKPKEKGRSAERPFPILPDTGEHQAMDLNPNSAAARSSAAHGKDVAGFSAQSVI